ncbi:zinc finger protein 821-like isoform X1 [Anguilla rostrata]|uniref:zinc finger protein 821-like isoform X1 n=2 Tax=Anguilla rostrata TaxID=7938 RepID=UPI0030D23C37
MFMRSECTPNGCLFWEYILTSKIVENCRGLEEIRVFSCRERGYNMSRRKQTNPFKVNWPFPPAGLSGPELALKMEGREDLAEDSECHSSYSQEPEEQDSMSDDSDSDLDNPGEDSSSNSSADDSMTGMKSCRASLQEAHLKEESEEGADPGNGYVCPLCTLEFGSAERLVAHVYQHTAMAGSRSSYVCPVCARVLSSPGSLGRHLLIHSEDRLSNCAVCGARFTDCSSFNREKLREFLSAGHSESSSSDEACPLPPPLSGPAHSLSPALPSLTDSLFSPPPSLPPLPDGLGPPGAGLPPLPDLLSPVPVYPAGVLLVCNGCAAYRRLAAAARSPDAQAWAGQGQEGQEPAEARGQRLERERLAKQTKRARESAEERELRRLRDRQAKRLQRMQETQEQRARRLQRDREAMRLKRASETPERRQARLVREREAKRLKRRLEKIEPSLRSQIEHDPAAMAALTADMSLFQFPCPPLDNGVFMKLP